MKGGKATAQRNKCRVIKNGIELSTEDFKYLSQKKDGLIIYYSIIKLSPNIYYITDDMGPEGAVKCQIRQQSCEGMIGAWKIHSQAGLLMPGK